MRNVFPYLCCLILLRAALIDDAFAQGRKRIIAALDEVAAPIESVDLEAPSDDLAAIAHHWQGARVLGLGEGTHGTHEFFAFKARVIRYAIEQQGFRIVAFEAPFDLELVNAYIQRGEGDLGQLIYQLSYWPWITKEVATLLEWLKAYNLALPTDEKVRFVGIDMQSTRGAKKWLNLAATHGWELGSQSEAWLDSLANLSAYQLGRRSPAWRDSAIRQVAALRSWTETHVAAIDQVLTPGEQAYALRHLQVLAQSIGCYQQDQTASAAYWNWRDSCMASSTLWLLREAHPGEKMLLWAHNGHLDHQEIKFSFGYRKAMGYYLKQEMGDQYYSLGMDFDRGAFRAKGPRGTIQTFEIEAAPRRSAPGYLRGATPDMFFLDWATVQQVPNLTRWSQRKLGYHSMGSGYYPDIKAKRYLNEGDVPAEHFDGWFFVKNTTAAHSIIKPQVEAELPLAGLLGRRIRLQAWLRPLADNPATVKPYLLMPCWTADRTLATLQAEVTWDSVAQRWTLSLDDVVHPDTEILKLYLRNGSDQTGFDLDAITLEVADGADHWREVPAFTLDFESEADLEALTRVPELQTERRREAALEGEWGLRVRGNNP